jgi:hypothetical protein
MWSRQAGQKLNAFAFKQLPIFLNTGRCNCNLQHQSTLVRIGSYLFEARRAAEITCSCGIASQRKSLSSSDSCRCSRYFFEHSAGNTPRFCRKAVNCRSGGAVLGFIQPGRANRFAKATSPVLEGM